MKTRSNTPNKLDTYSNYLQRVYRCLNKFKYFPSSRPYNLSICHETKFIWFRVAKVGTRSIYNHLKSSVPLAASHPYSVYYQPFLYRDYFKFAFARNPWDRLVSYWHNKVIESNYFRFNQHQYSRMQHFKNFIDFVSGLNVESCDPHLRLRCRLIELDNIDYVGRFETIGQDYKEVCNRLELSTENFRHENKSDRSS